MPGRSAWSRTAAVTALLLAIAGRSEAGPRLDYRGTVIPGRQVEALMRPALNAPGDSMALSHALGELVARLQNIGYLDAGTRVDWLSSPSTLRLTVDEGRRYRLAKITIEMAAKDDSALVARGLELRVGQWASPLAIAGAIEKALEEAVDQGHPYAQLNVSSWEADSLGLSLGIGGALGPRVTITQVRFEGLRATRPTLAEKSMGRLVGLPYNRSVAERARGRLEQLGLFRSVVIQGLEGEGDWNRAHLLYRVEEPHYNQFEGAVGFQGEAGPVGLVKIDLGNLLGTGRSVGLHWDSRGPGVMNVSARYGEPLVFGLPLRLEGILDQQVQDTVYVRTRWGASARFALSGQERLEAGYTEERVVQERAAVEEANLRSTIFAMDRSSLDSPLGPRRGSHVRLSATEIFKTEHLRPAGQRRARASAAELRGDWHQPISGRTGIALELQSAGRFSSERVLPFYERYPLGGATSLRGYDEEAFWIDRYALTRLEWRWFLGEVGERAFLFWDHAWSGPRVGKPEGGDRWDVEHHDGLGFGLRLKSGAGVLGLDYGLKPGSPPLEGKIHLQLSSAF